MTARTSMQVLRQSDAGARLRWLLLITVMVLGGIAGVQADTVYSLTQTRPPIDEAAPGFTGPVVQSFVVVDPPPDEPAKAIVLSFAGGGGKLGIADGELALGTNNFLVRTRHLLAAHGYVVVVMDAASDFLTLPTGLRGFRRSRHHLSDIRLVIGYVQDLYPDLPVWVNGTSRGSISAASYAAQSQANPAAVDGLVLTAPVTVQSGPPNENLFDTDLDEIPVPVFVGWHEQDLCWVTPPGDMAAVAAALTSAPKVRQKFFTGGLPSLFANQCQALSAHGFLGIEARVVKRIAKFIAKQSP